jgi:hypothetical protein
MFNFFKKNNNNEIRTCDRSDIILKKINSIKKIKKLNKIIKYNLYYLG